MQKKESCCDSGQREIILIFYCIVSMCFTVVPFGQGFKDISPPTKELMKLTLEQKLAHGGHPVLLSTMIEAFSSCKIQKLSNFNSFCISVHKLNFFHEFMFTLSMLISIAIFMLLVRMLICSPLNMLPIYQADA